MKIEIKLELEKKPTQRNPTRFNVISRRKQGAWWGRWRTQAEFSFTAASNELRIGRESGKKQKKQRQLMENAWEVEKN